MTKLYGLLQTIQSQANNSEKDTVSWPTPGGFLHSNVDPEVVSEFVKVFFSADVDRASWAAKRCALQVALILFGRRRLRQWIRLTTRGEGYGQRQDEFLEDTLRFIYKGERRLSVQNWRPLVVDNPSEIQYRVKRENFPYHTDISMSECLSRWCAHPKGLQDMVCALDILFGRHLTLHPHEDNTATFNVKL